MHTNACGQAHVIRNTALLFDSDICMSQCSTKLKGLEYISLIPMQARAFQSGALYIIVVKGVEPGDGGGACMATSWP